MTVQHSNIISLINELPNVKNIYQFGLSGFMSNEEFNELNRHHKVHTYFRNEFKKAKIERYLPTYITIDIDVFDSNYISSVSYPNVGGWSFNDFIDFIKRYISDLNVIGIDIVEYDKSKDKDGKGAILVNNVILELLGLI